MEQLSDIHLTLIALWVFGVYRTSTVRRDLIQREAEPAGPGAMDLARLFSCFRQFLNQGVLGHCSSGRV